MAIFAGSRLIKNYTGMNDAGIKQVRGKNKLFFPDPEIKFTVAANCTATQSRIKMQSSVGGTQVVISIKRGASYISTVESMTAFNVSFQSGDEVTILGQINIFTLENTIPISYFEISNHYRIDKVYVRNNSTLTEALFHNNSSFDILDMRNNNLTSFTVTSCANLASLYLTDNSNLVNLDMSQMKPLMNLAYINRCGLTAATVIFPSIGFSSMLEISENPLGTLDLTLLTRLGKLRAHYTGISTIDFSTVPQVTYIRIDGNNLTTIDTSNLPYLTFLRCHSQPITSLNFQYNTLLEELHCSYCKLATLDFTYNPYIKVLEYYGGGVSSTLTNIIWGSSNDIYHINVNGNKLSSSEINDILIELDGNGIVGTECQLNLQTPLAPPTGSGITAKASLISKGWSWVVTD